MSTSVQITQTNVPRMPIVLTHMAATLVSVVQDTKDMDIRFALVR